MSRAIFFLLRKTNCPLPRLMYVPLEKLVFKLIFCSLALRQEELDLVKLWATLQKYGQYAERSPNRRPFRNCHGQLSQTSINSQNDRSHDMNIFLQELDVFDRH